MELVGDPAVYVDHAPVIVDFPLALGKPLTGTERRHRVMLPSDLGNITVGRPSPGGDGEDEA